MTDLQQLIDLYGPEPNTCIFHLDESGAHVFDFVANVAEDESRVYLDGELEITAIWLGGPLYLCHAFEGGSWNDAPVNFYSDEGLYDLLVESAPKELPIEIQVIDLSRSVLVARRSERLSAKVTEAFLSGLKLQKEQGLDQLLAIETLGDSKELLHVLTQPGAPPIHEIVVDHASRTTMIRADLTPAREKNEPRPRWILRSLERVPSVDFRYYEGRVAYAAALRASAPWKHCFVPVAEVIYNEVEREKIELDDQLAELGIAPENRDEYIEDAVRNVGNQTYAYTNFTIVLNWRQSQGVYRFDPEILRGLYLTTLPIHLDPAILTRLPEYCVYIETPGLLNERAETLHGVFVMVESVPRESSLQRYDTRLYISCDSGPADKLTTANIFTFSLDRPTLKESLATLSSVDIQSGTLVPRADLVSWLTPIISQMLYICSTEPEIKTDSQPGKLPTRPLPQKTRKGYRLFPPPFTTIWECGWRTGAAIRYEEERQQKQSSELGGGRRSPRGHVRRAHWHTFYAGPKAAKTRETRLHWLSMINVNLPLGSDRPTVVRPVKQEVVINPS